MTADTREEPQNSVESLERSVAGFALVACVAAVITFVLLLISPLPTDSLYARIRLLILLAAAAVSALAMGVTGWLWRRESARERTAAVLASLLRSRILALASALVLLEANVLAAVALRQIAPDITSPLRFLLLSWSLIFGGLLLLAHWDQIGLLWRRSREIWAVFGLSLLMLSLILLLATLNQQWLAASGFSSALRGWLDYRELRFLEVGDPPDARRFWAEQSQTSARWLPYNYWTLAPYAGEFITINGQGLRHTPQVTDDPLAPKVYFFGGSTIWGEGARDAYTIPAQVGRLLEAAETEVLTRNFGQMGYVSAQDSQLFQAQLTLGRPPTAAVFYQGFNDALSAYQQGVSGIPLQEAQRVADVEAGRLLRRGQPVLRLPAVDLADYDWSLVGAHKADAAAIAARWLENRRLLQTLGDAYGVRLLFVWQPALFAKSTLAGAEPQILADLDEAFVALYREVDQIVRQAAARESDSDLLVLTELFADVEDEIFIDMVHINEIGNQRVSEAISDWLLLRAIAK